MIDPNKLCMGCMRPVPNQKICPYCGFSIQKYERSRNAQILPCYSILGGRYLIGKVIGEGGFGITYIGIDLENQKRVAVKEYFPVGVVSRDLTHDTQSNVTLLGKESRDYYKSGLESFTEEALNLQNFRGIQGVISSRDFFYENGTAYLVMDYIQGKTLKEYMEERKGPLTEAQALGFIRPVLNALSKVHQMHVIHRDISPENIMIMDDGSTCLIDFGSARFSTGAETKTLTVLLKRGYAPVEQYQTRSRQGPWTDIYAICAVLYWMMSGIVPEESLDRMVADQLVPLDELSQNSSKIQVSYRTSQVIKKGLAIKGKQRYQSLQELIHDLYESEEEIQFSDLESDLGRIGTENFGSQYINSRYVSHQYTEKRYENIPAAVRKSSENKKVFFLLGGVLAAIIILTISLMSLNSYTGLGNSSEVAALNTQQISDRLASLSNDPYMSEEITYSTAKLVALDKADLDSCKRLSVKNAYTVLPFNNTADNLPLWAFDRKQKTVWRQWPDEAGSSDILWTDFDKAYQIKYLTVCCGDWTDKEAYYKSGRPKKLQITAGSEVFQIELPDSAKKMCIQLSKPVTCSIMCIQILDSYQGDIWNSSCISDIGIYVF